MAVTPLDCLRVLDLGQVFAGPYAGRLLADIGAEVIRVEAAARSGRGGLVPQPGVSYPDGQPGERPYNRSAYYNELNRNKLAVSLDLSKPPGQEVFKRLVEISDVVIENFSPRVMANFGLDYPVLKEVNPGIIMISISAYGQTGPYRDYVSFGRGIEAMSGLSDLTGYADSQPLGPGIAYADATAGLHAAFAARVRFRHRRRTGEGQHIDLTLRESLTALLGEQIMDYSMNRRTAVRQGNRDCQKGFQGCYRCRGDDGWIAVSICSDEEWRALGLALGNPPWMDDPRFQDDPARRANQDELDKLIEVWTIERGSAEAMKALQGAGVRAGMVCGADELFRDPHLRARGFFQSVTHPEAGTHLHSGVPWKMSLTPASIRLPAPCFAQHHDYVFGELLGMSIEEISALEEAGIIADSPTR